MKNSKQIEEVKKDHENKKEYNFTIRMDSEDLRGFMEDLHLVLEQRIMYKKELNLNYHPYNFWRQKSLT